MVIVQMVKRALTKFLPYSRPASQHADVNARRRRTNILLASITVIFFVAWSPMVIFTFIYDFANHILPEKVRWVIEFLIRVSKISNIIHNIVNFLHSEYDAESEHRSHGFLKILLGR